MKNKYLIKYLIFGLKKKSGHNNLGRITVFNRGGGHRRKYRIIDYKRNLYDILGSVVEIQYDPNRSSNIALVAYSNGALSYILATEGLKKGDKVMSSKRALIKLGNCIQLFRLTSGILINNLELYPEQGGQVARSAGTSAMLLRQFNDKYSVIKLPSGVERLINNKCKCTLGVISNSENKLLKKSKAGNNRWLGKKPTVRGVAMNPIDHPHGGGEGKKSGKRLTPWGKHINRRLIDKNRFVLTKYNVKKK
jgi:large subunit ribosomal protein L2